MACQCWEFNEPLCLWASIFSSVNEDNNRPYMVVVRIRNICTICSKWTAHDWHSKKVDIIIIMQLSYRCVDVAQFNHSFAMEYLNCLLVSLSICDYLYFCYELKKNDENVCILTCIGVSNIFQQNSSPGIHVLMWSFPLECG